MVTWDMWHRGVAKNPGSQWVKTLLMFMKGPLLTFTDSTAKQCLGMTQDNKDHYETTSIMESKAGFFYGSFGSLFTESAFLTPRKNDFLIAQQNSTYQMPWLKNTWLWKMMVCQQERIHKIPFWGIGLGEKTATYFGNRS